MNIMSLIKTTSQPLFLNFLLPSYSVMLNKRKKNRPYPIKVIVYMIKLKLQNIQIYIKLVDQYKLVDQ